MAHGFLAGLSRDCELIPDSPVAGLRRAVPALRSIRMDSHHHAPEPANVRRGSTSRAVLSRGGKIVRIVFFYCDSGPVLACDVRICIADGESPQHEARCVIAEQYAYFQIGRASCRERV